MDESQDSNKIKYHKRKRWTQSEDNTLKSLVHVYGQGEWAMIARNIENRNSQQCRERWMNHLDPAINKSPFTDEEWETVTNAQKLKGNSWSEIAELLPGRTAVHIKNEWHRRRRKNFKKTKKSKKSGNSGSSHEKVFKNTLVVKRIEDEDEESFYFPEVQVVRETAPVYAPVMNYEVSHVEVLPPMKLHLRRGQSPGIDWNKVSHQIPDRTLISIPDTLRTVTPSKKTNPVSIRNLLASDSSEEEPDYSAFGNLISNIPRGHNFPDQKRSREGESFTHDHDFSKKRNVEFTNSRFGDLLNVASFIANEEFF